MKMLPFGKALVTGGAGFIGSHLVDRLIEEGTEVTVLDDFSTGSIKNLEASSKSRMLKISKGSINDKELLRSELAGVEVVFHLASVTPSKERQVTTSYLNAVNVNGTIDLLESCVRTGVRRFVFASSAEVYGSQSKLPLSETSNLNPMTENGWSKFLGEKACFEFWLKTGIKTTVLRYFNVYGERSPIMPARGVVNEFAEKLLLMESPVIFGKGDHTRDFVHVKDVVIANILAGRADSAGRAYNVGSGTHVSIETLAEIESRFLLGDNVIIPFDYKLAKQIDVPNVYGDISLIREDLGYIPKHSVEEGLREYLSKLKNTLSLEVERPIPVRRV
jgi:UDP-glucose 4-epimerase